MDDEQAIPEWLRAAHALCAMTRDERLLAMRETHESPPPPASAPCTLPGRAPRSLESVGVTDGAGRGAGRQLEMWT